MSGRGDEVIRVGIAGQGRSGYDIHTAWLRKATDQYRIVAVADEIEERRLQAEHELDVRAYADYRDLIAAGGIDLFVNALPTPLHVGATIEAFEAGLHVVCEKPVAPTVEELDGMAAAAARSGKVLAPFQNNRFQPFFSKIREVVDSGVLGDILHVRSVWGSFARRWDWQTYQCNFGGVLYNTGPHAIDQGLVLFGEREEPKVFCKMEARNSLAGDAEDHCALTLYGSASPTIEILISGYLAYPQGEAYSLSGTRGGLTGSGSRLVWKYFDPAEAPRQEIWSRWSENRAYPSEKLPWIEKSWEVDSSIASGATSGYTLPSYEIGRKLFYDNIHAALTGGGKLLITVPQVRRQIAVIREAHRQNPLPRRYSAWVPGKGAVRAAEAS